MAWWTGLTPTDYVLLSILLAAFLYGWRRGLLAQVMRAGAFLVTVVVAGRYSPELQDWLNQHWQLQERLVKFLAARIHLPVEAYQAGTPVSPLQAARYVGGVPLPDLYRETLAHRLAAWQPGGLLTSPALLILDQLAAGLASTLSYLLLAAGIGIALGLAGNLLSAIIDSLSLLNTANRLTGGLLTCLEAAVAIMVVAALAAPALSLVGVPWLQGWLADSRLAPHFLTLFGWLRAFLFGLGTEQFFLI